MSWIDNESFSASWMFLLLQYEQALHASWEPRHSRHCYRFPWQRYVKLGNVLRHFGYTVVALHGCIRTEIQVKLEWIYSAKKDNMVCMPQFFLYFLFLIIHMIRNNIHSKRQKKKKQNSKGWWWLWIMIMSQRTS